MSLQAIIDPSNHTKTVTSQDNFFNESLEQMTDNPRFGNSVLTVISLDYEGSHLIEAFYAGGFWGYGFIPVFFFIYVF